MATFVMIGKYVAGSLAAISAARTEKAKKIIQDNGGSLKAAYALLGDSDVLLLVELPDVEKAVKVSVSLAKELGIAFSTLPAIPVEVFDKLMA